MNKFWMLVCVVMLIAAPQAGASTGWTRSFVGEYVSTSEEDLPAFLKRVGVEMNAYGKRKSVETCGAVAQNAEGLYSVRVSSDGVQRGCAIFNNDIAKGFVATGESIHSHPHRTTRLTAEDQAWAKHYNVHIAGFMINKKVGFSPNDFSSGPGWLIDDNKLFYQNGVNNVVEYGKLK